MDKLKEIFNVLDLILKFAIAAVAFMFFGVQKDRLEIESKQIENQGKQQTSNIFVAEKIITLLFDERLKCISEDQVFMIDFLIQNNNHYNQIKLSEQDFYSASAKRRNCTGAIAADAMASKSVSKQLVPILANQKDIETVQKALTEPIKVEEISGNVKPSGYVAVGIYSFGENSFRNFEVSKNQINSSDATIKKDTVIRPLWAVYLRANTSNTEQGQNPILGILSESSCVSVLESFPSTRGQTWAAVKFANCPPKKQS